MGLREINGSRGDFGGACPRRWGSLEEADGADRACVFQFQWQDEETADFCRPPETSNSKQDDRKLDKEIILKVRIMPL